MWTWRTNTEKDEEMANEEAICNIFIANLTYPEQHTKSELRQAQIADPDLRKVRMWVKSNQKPTRNDIRNESLQLRQYLSIFEMLFLNRDNLLFRKAQPNEFVTQDRLCLPERLQKDAIKNCHELTGGHMGIHTTQYRVLNRFYFPELFKTVESYVTTKSWKEA